MRKLIAARLLGPHRFAVRLGVVVGVGLLAALLQPPSAGAAMCDPISHPDWQCIDEVIIKGDPVAPIPQKADGSSLPGTGLCGAFKQTGEPRVVFPTRDSNWPSNAAQFPTKLNEFMDVRAASGLNGPRNDETLLRIFDLSNNVGTVGDDATGDYATPGCFASNRGCPFPGSQSGSVINAFGSRFRGFFVVRPDQERQPIHFGIFADNAVALTIYAKPLPGEPQLPLQEYLVLSHGLDFNPKVRVTNKVTFRKAGLYPIEIVHAQFDSAAILEVVVMFNELAWYDLDQLDNPMSGNQFKLSQVVSGRGPMEDRPAFGFTYLGDPATVPENFFQTISGAPPYLALAQCAQCPRKYADVPNQSPSATTCDPGYYCNAAAVCSPCNGDNFCGKTCKACEGVTPYCIPSPADPTDATCVQCRDTPDCAIGQLCVGHVCITPNLCCPDRPHLIAPDSATPSLRVCSPCSSAADCGEGRQCDRLNARCVDKIPDCNTDDRCGTACVDCKTVEGNRPHCLNGQVCVTCRNDFECDAGKYCESGDCKPCLADRHCGKSCKSCGRSISLGPDGMSAEVQVTDKPFCYSFDDTVGNASCVRCIKDSDCGAGGRCDVGTHDCAKTTCTPACEPGKFCDGSRCVDCYNSAQCPCGRCDLETGTCTGICDSNADCMGNQCCTRDTDGLRKCLPGRCAGVAGGALCGCSVAAVAPAVVDNNTLSAEGVELSRSRGGLLALAAMLLCALWLRRGIRLTRTL